MGEIHVGLLGSDAVTLAGAAFPSGRASGVPPPHYPSRTGGNPRISPGSSVVIAALLFEGVAWYAACRSARSVVEISGERSGCRTSSFSRSTVVSISFSFLLLVFFSLLGVFVLFAPAVVSQLYGWLLY